MKKNILLLISVLGGFSTFAQTNKLNATGSVGINTLSPENGWLLDVNGLGTIGTQGNARIYMGTTDATHAFIQSRDNSINQNLEFDANVVNFNTGNVGIGTTNPGAKLDVRIPYSKTDNATIRYALSLGSNDSSNPSVLNFVSTGGSAQSVRHWEIQTSEEGVVDGGSLNLQAYGGNVGIGTTNPTQGLQLISSNPSGSFGTFSSSSGQGFTINPNSTAGVVNVFADNLGGTEPKLHLSTYSNRINSKGLNIDALGNVGIGTLQPDQTLTVNGTIHSSEVKVDNKIPVPDYVFENGYVLPELITLKTYVDANHHLPEIPSASEIQKNGLNLGELNLKLLKKVEELTLCLIEKDKLDKEKEARIEEQQKRLNQQQVTNKQLNDRLTALEQTLAKLMTTK